MSFFSDFTAINKIVFRKTNEAFTRNLLLIPMLGLYILVYTIVTIILGMTIGALGMAGSTLASIISWFFSCYMISDYLTHLEGAVSGFKFRLKEVGKNYMRFFIPLLAATAIPRIIIYLIARLSGLLIPFYWVVLFYLAYATAEVVYQKNLDRLEIFVYGHKFLLENWQHWLLINMVHGFVIVGFMKLVDMFIVLPLSNLMMNLPFFISLPVTGLVSATIIGIPALYYMIYRGFIFKILSVSSRRKREYMRNIYGK